MIGLYATARRSTAALVLTAALTSAAAILVDGPASAIAAPANAAATALNWKACSGSSFKRWRDTDGASLTGFDCAALVRPLDASRPGGAKARLAVARLKANGTAAQYKGTLFMNPGGPGNSGLALSSIIGLLPPAIRASFDFVTWDPRGIGASTPLISGSGCNIPKPTRPATGAVNWQSVLERRVRQVTAYNARCYRGNSHVIENSGTVANARDLDLLRQAVGDAKLTYWGISYGTLLGSTYAQLYPTKVRALVFDGNMDPQTTLYAINAGSVAPDHSIGFFLEANPTLAPKFRTVMKLLDSKTLKLPDGTRYSRWDVLDVLNDDVPFFVDPDGDWTEAQQVIESSYTALTGSGTARQQALKALTSKSLQSPSTGTAGSLWSAVVCQDFADRPNAAARRSGISWAVQQGPLYGGSLGVDYLSTCTGYGKAKPHPVPRPKSYGPDVPGIVANSTRDGETPYQWAVNMARTYRKMRMLTLVGGIHGIFGLSESECVDSAIADFLISAQTPSIDLTCPFSPPRQLP